MAKRVPKKQADAEDLALLDWRAIGGLTLVHMVIGGLWAEAFMATRLEAFNFPVEKIKDFQSPPTALVLAIGAAFVTNLFMAWFLRRVGARTAVEGALWGAGLWVMLILPPLAVMHSYRWVPFTVTFIDCGDELVKLLLTGAVLGSWGWRR